MIRFVDGTLDPLLRSLAFWSIRWGVLILILAAWLWARPPRRASTRHLLCLTTLAAGLFLPLAPRWAAPWPSLAAAPMPVAIPAPTPPRVFDPGPIEDDRPDLPVIARTVPIETPRPAMPAPAARPAGGPAPPDSPGAWCWVRLGLGATWLAGMVACLARLAVGGLVLGRLRARSRAVGASDLALCRSELGLRRRVVLASHPAVGSPVLLGGVSAMILVPEDWDHWPAGARRACLLHELAHLDRRDDWAKLTCGLARAPFWFHPGVGWLLARLDREAELACDEAAVGLGVAPIELARLLLDFARRPRRLDLRGLSAAGRALSFFDRGTVSTRITRLLEDDMTRTIRTPSKLRSIGLAATVAALAMAIGGASLRAIEAGPLATAQVPAKDGPPASGRSFEAEVAEAQAKARANAKAKGRPPAEGRSFEVEVKDAEGRPIGGATVVAGIIENEAGRDATVAKTGDDGIAWFGREPRDGVWVVAFKEGHSFTCRNLFDPTGVIPTPLTLPRAQAVAGTVVDPEGRPVEGADVRVAGAAGMVPLEVHHLAPALGSLVRGTSIERAVAARSDAGGKFRLDSVPAGSTLMLTTSAEGKATTSTRRLPGNADALTRITLAPEARVAGQIISQVDGVGVAGLGVTLKGAADRRSDSLVGRATTDAWGRFQIRGLGEGSAFLMIDGVPADGPWTYAAAIVGLKPGATSDAAILISRGVAVDGKVVSTDGRPIPGASVAVNGARNPIPGPEPIRVVTDAEGIFRVRLAPGVLHATLAGSVPGYTTLGNSPAPRIMILPVGLASFSLPPIEVAPAAGTLRGRIVDAVGSPLAGAKLIGVCNQTYCMPLNQPSATADDSGRFSLDTQADGQPIPLNQSVTFQVRTADGQEFDASLVATGAAEVMIKLPTFARGGPKGPEQVEPDELAGVVVDVQGRPIPGVLAVAYSWMPNWKALSDARGLFRVKVPERGKIEIRLTKDGYEPREFLARPTGKAGWVVVMGASTYFEGRVLAADGSPLADAPIRVDSGPKRMDGGLMTNCFTEGKSGPEGRYRLLVEPGMYEFQVRVAGLGVLRLPGQAIATDQAKYLDLRLAPGVDFEAKVVDADDGSPVEGFVLKDWQNPVIRGTSDARGVLKIASMMPGRFNFGLIESDRHARWWSDACQTEWTRYEKSNRFGFQRNLDGLDFDMQPGMSPVIIKVEKAATIRGRVLDPDGKPVAGATVAPALTGSGNSLTGDTRFSVETDKDGAYTMRLPASGEIAYNLVAHDGKYLEWRTWANGVLAPFKTTPGQVMEGVDLRLARPATVRGRVVDASGLPVDGREVRASAADKRENRYYDPTTKTRPDGTFELRFVRDGEQHIQVAPFWLEADQAPAGTSRLITLTAGKDSEGVELIAGPGR